MSTSHGIRVGRPGFSFERDLGPALSRWGASFRERSRNRSRGPIADEFDNPKCLPYIVIHEDIFAYDSPGQRARRSADPGHQAVWEDQERSCPRGPSAPATAGAV